MNYTSPTFWLLFLAVYAFYWRLDHRRQNALLLVASYVFYGAWDFRFLYLILISTVVDYIGGLGVAGVALSRRRLLSLLGLLVGTAAAIAPDVPSYGVPAFVWLPLGSAAVFGGYFALLPRLYALPEARRRKTFLWISMVANLAILGFFKYCDFFVGSLTQLGQRLGFDLHPTTLGILLPAGISFYTFQAMSYTIDIYRRHVEPTRSFADFALFVCFFPHLVAGPIMRAHTLLPQVTRRRSLRPGDVAQGWLLVLVGLFKKMVVADNLAPIANAVFFRFDEGRSAGVSGGEVLVAVWAFAFQIYGDFSGYSAIARGISKWLGFDLVINFRQPYLAQSPSDFWRRWHISLSTWLRDYLYIPLGGNRFGTLKTYRNLMATMLLGGLWHGANWTFVGWGFLHGLLLCGFRALGIRDTVPGRGWRPTALRLLRIALMFQLVCLGWLLFRAESFQAALDMLTRVAVDLRFPADATTALALVLLFAAPLFVLELLTDGEDGIERIAGWPWLVQGVAYAWLVGSIVVLRAESHEFIYFQF